jgi:hypothetical protein
LLSKLIYMNKEELKKIVVKLVELGEDKDELNYWLDIFEDLPDEKQKEIFSNFQEELTELSSLD